MRWPFLFCMALLLGLGSVHANNTGLHKFNTVTPSDMSNILLTTSQCKNCNLPQGYPISLCAHFDIWDDTSLKKLAHAAETSKTTHTLLAQESVKIAHQCGVPAICNESLGLRH